jgi:hypothetical protein
MTFTFAGTIGSWITDDWELVERVLDFRPKKLEDERCGQVVSESE